jgi:radical SAM superfamily enzyme YgiQ (UPF0313 family)
MDILLINSSFFELWEKNKSLRSIFPPLGLLYLAAVAEKKGHKVQIFDMHERQSTLHEVVKEAKKKDLVGITCVTPTANITYNLSRMIKEENPDIEIVVGGPHPSALPEEPLKTNNVDVVIVGEGEHTFSVLLDCLENGVNFSKVNGIYYKDGNEIHNTPLRKPIINLDSIPYPAYHLVDVKKYFYPYQKKRSLGSILTSRGCPNTCTYCNKNIFGCGFRCRTPESVVNEIIYMVEKHKVRDFLVCDDNFTALKERAIKICHIIRDENLDIEISFSNGLRVDKVDSEVLCELKKAGCYLIGYGIESGKQKILNSVKKNIKIDQIRRTVRLTKKFGINIVGYFIIGFPSDTEKSIKTTIKFSKDLNILSKFSILTPYPGTEMFKMLEKEGRILTYDWSKYGVHQEPIFKHPNLSSKQIFELYREAYRTIYSNPKLIIQEIFATQDMIHFLNTIKTGWNLFGDFFR